MAEVNFVVGDTASEDETDEECISETVSAEKTDENTTMTKLNSSTAKKFEKKSKFTSNRPNNAQKTKLPARSHNEKTRDI